MSLRTMVRTEASAGFPRVSGDEPDRDVFP